MKIHTYTNIKRHIIESLSVIVLLFTGIHIVVHELRKMDLLPSSITIQFNQSKSNNDSTSKTRTHEP